MNVYTTLPARLKPFYLKELDDYHRQFHQGNLSIAWRHLERAHIIGQRYPFAHTYIHWKMLQFGFKIKSIKEISGQIPRLVFGGIKSFVGKVPVGNPGGSNVPPLKPFPIENEIKEIFLTSGVQS